MSFILLLFSMSNLLAKPKGRLPDLEYVEVSFDYIDDMDFSYMLQAIERQIEHFSRINLDVEIQVGDRQLTRNHLYLSLLRFQDMVMDAKICLQIQSRSDCQFIFNHNIKNEFEAYRPIPMDWERGYEKNKTLFTAYFTPDFKGSFTKTERFRNPIYGKPKSKHLRNKTSDEINFEGALQGENLELFYVDASLYDIWLLHVQGGGRVQVEQPDQSIQYYYLSYAGSNKKKFRMLYPYMIKQKMLSAKNPGINQQRKYLDTHPHHVRQVLSSCPSFIFFKITEDEPAGVHVPLTVARSIATDNERFLEYGLINYIRLTKPNPKNRKEKVSIQRFYLNQDTGGAIEGNARVDLYMGYGEEAANAAYSTHHLGEQYILILK